MGQAKSVCHDIVKSTGAWYLLPVSYSKKNELDILLRHEASFFYKHVVNLPICVENNKTTATWDIEPLLYLHCVL